MFTTPYMRKILEALEKIWKGHEDSFFWEPDGELGRLNENLNKELRKCRDDKYSNANYLFGPADEWIEEARKHHLI